MLDPNERVQTGRSIRGWLSDIYVPVLLEREERVELHKALVGRLGNRAGVDDPLFGRAAGLEELALHVERLSDWMLKHQATYERDSFTMGVDRDVTEGRLTLVLDGKPVELPIAVVAEKRKSREVELRVYFATQPIKGAFVDRPAIVPKTDELALPPIAQTYVDAVRSREVKPLVDAFEHDGVLREAKGTTHSRQSGELEAFFRRRLEVGTMDMDCGGFADDGRTCALEYTLTRKRKGRDAESTHAGLALFERGESGLLKSARFYDDVE